jgi:hypothetical protein
MMVADAAGQVVGAETIGARFITTPMPASIYINHTSVDLPIRTFGQVCCRTVVITHSTLRNISAKTFGARLILAKGQTAMDIVIAVTYLAIATLCKIRVGTLIVADTAALGVCTKTVGA